MSIKQRTLAALRLKRQQDRLVKLPQLGARSKLMQSYARKALNTGWYGRVVVEL